MTTISAAPSDSVSPIRYRKPLVPENSSELAILQHKNITPAATRDGKGLLKVGDHTYQVKFFIRNNEKEFDLNQEEWKQVVLKVGLIIAKQLDEVNNINSIRINKKRLKLDRESIPHKREQKDTAADFQELENYLNASRAPEAAVTPRHVSPTRTEDRLPTHQLPVESPIRSRNQRNDQIESPRSRRNTNGALVPYTPTPYTPNRSLTNRPRSLTDSILRSPFNPNYSPWLSNLNRIHWGSFPQDEEEFIPLDVLPLTYIPPATRSRKGSDSSNDSAQSIPSDGANSPTEVHLTPFAEDDSAAQALSSGSDSDSPLQTNKRLLQFNKSESTDSPFQVKPFKEVRSLDDFHLNPNYSDIWRVSHPATTNIDIDRPKFLSFLDLSSPDATINRFHTKSPKESSPLTLVSERRISTPKSSEDRTRLLPSNPTTTIINPLSHKQQYSNVLTSSWKTKTAFLDQLSSQYSTYTLTNRLDSSRQSLNSLHQQMSSFLQNLFTDLDKLPDDSLPFIEPIPPRNSPRQITSKSASFLDSSDFISHKALTYPITIAPPVKLSTTIQTGTIATLHLKKEPSPVSRALKLSTNPNAETALIQPQQRGMCASVRSNSSFKTYASQIGRITFIPLTAENARLIQEFGQLLGLPDQSQAFASYASRKYPSHVLVKNNTQTTSVLTTSSSKTGTLSVLQLDAIKASTVMQSLKALVGTSAASPSLDQFTKHYQPVALIQASHIREPLVAFSSLTGGLALLQLVTPPLLKGKAITVVPPSNTTTIPLCTPGPRPFIPFKYLSTELFDKPPLSSFKSRAKSITYDFSDDTNYRVINEKNETFYWNDIPNGNYKFLMKDGTIIKGKFEYSQLNGEGSIHTRDGCKVIGTFKNNRLTHGSATFIQEDGSRILMEGSFQDDRLHGKGIAYYYNRDGHPNFALEGEFIDGQLRKGQLRAFHLGAGIEKSSGFTSDIIYEGTFNNKTELEGKGSITFGDLVYTGNFNEGRLEGEGTLTVDKNVQITGHFHYGKLTGPVTVTSTTGKPFIKAGIAVKTSETFKGTVEGDTLIWEIPSQKKSRDIEKCVKDIAQLREQPLIGTIDSFSCNFDYRYRPRLGLYQIVHEKEDFSVKDARLSGNYCIMRKSCILQGTFVNGMSHGKTLQMDIDRGLRMIGVFNQGDFVEGEHQIHLGENIYTSTPIENKEDFFRLLEDFIRNQSIRDIPKSLLLSRELTSSEELNDQENFDLFLQMGRLREKMGIKQIPTPSVDYDLGIASPKSEPSAKAVHLVHSTPLSPTSVDLPGMVREASTRSTSPLPIMELERIPTPALSPRKLSSSGVSMTPITPRATMSDSEFDAAFTELGLPPDTPKVSIDRKESSKRDPRDSIARNLLSDFADVLPPTPIAARAPSSPFSPAKFYDYQPSGNVSARIRDFEKIAPVTPAKRPAALPTGPSPSILAARVLFEKKPASSAAAPPAPRPTPTIGERKAALINRGQPSSKA